MKRIKNIIVFCCCLVIGRVAMAQPLQPVKITELEEIIAASRQPLVINFWATWCRPCIEEIPYFEKIAAKYRRKKVRLLLVSLDMEDDTASVMPFAKKRGFKSDIVWLNETDADYFCPKVDEKWQGSIPATLFVHNKKGYRRFFEKQLKEEELHREIKAMLR